MVKIGDIFEISLSDDRKAYGHYVFSDKNNGPIICVFDKITKKNNIIINELVDGNPLFPPVITGLAAAIRSGIWRIIGNIPVTNFVYPKFVSTLWDQKSGEASMWFVWDGEKYTKIGKSLTEELKILEFLVVWSPYDIVERIETNKYPYPYGDLIKYNKFTPR
jgi:hypothetical protein